MSGQEIRWPRLWLMTDKKLDATLWEALEAVPAGVGGVMLRHEHLPPHERAALAWRLREETRTRQIKLGIERDWELASAVGADLVHNSITPLDMACSFTVHDEMEADQARIRGAALAFVSPVHETRTHPEAKPLGKEKARALADYLHCPAVAMGGMNQDRFRELGKAFVGWAGIDDFLKSA